MEQVKFFSNYLAERYGCHHYSIAGFVGGMAVMAASLLVI